MSTITVINSSCDCQFVPLLQQLCNDHEKQNVLLIHSTHKRSLFVHNAHHVTHGSASNTHYVQRVFIAGQHHFRFTLLLVLSLSVVVFVKMLLYATLAHTHIYHSHRWFIFVSLNYLCLIKQFFSRSISEILPLLFVCTVDSTELNLGI